MVVWLLEFYMIRISVVFSTMHIIFAPAEASRLPSVFADAMSVFTVLCHVLP